jgi:hypothetical protein
MTPWCLTPLTILNTSLGSTIVIFFLSVIMPAIPIPAQPPVLLDDNNVDFVVKKIVNIKYLQ